MHDSIATIDQAKNTLLDLAIRFGPRLLTALMIVIVGIVVSRWFSRWLGRGLSRIELEPPLFAKPIAEGSSKGINDHSRIADRGQLAAACSELLRAFDQPVLVESYLPGREVTVGIVGNGCGASVVGVMEVLFKEGNDHDYTALNKDEYEQRVTYRLLDGEPLGERARQVCLRLLTLAPRTRAQLADALRKRGIPDETADEVLSRFEDVGLIDDAAFARAWVESRHYGRGLAGRALSAELKQRGVAADEIRAAIEERLGPDAEVSAARRLIDKKLESTKALPPDQRTRRLAGMLARKGYPAGLAFRVIREALEAEGDLAFPEDEPVFDEADSDTE